MAGLDADTLELILSTLGKYADKTLALAYLLALDRNDEFPYEVLKERHDPNTLGLPPLSIPKECGGMRAWSIAHRRSAITVWDSWNSTSPARQIVQRPYTADGARGVSTC
jgi:hypothetical protein